MYVARVAKSLLSEYHVRSTQVVLSIGIYYNPTAS